STVSDDLPNKAKIFVDGNCIVCDYEVSHYKRLAPQAFELVDISDPQFQAQNFGLTPEAVQQRMHLITPNGMVVTGIEAFSYIWSQIPKYKFAAQLINWPLINGAAKIGYNLFAKYRHLLPKKKR
ncbi:MAG: DUF393 domain-containing protein, partial [Bdellovibrionota bacterium]